MQVVTEVFTESIDNPNYVLTSQKETATRVRFHFNTPNGEYITHLPKRKRDFLGRWCLLHLVYFCEKKSELVPTPVYWAIPEYLQTTDPMIRPKKS